MGGEITVSSRYGEGSTFTVVIPQTMTEQSAPIAVVEKPETKPVLLYERYAIYADSIVRALKAFRVPVWAASSLEELFRKLETGKYAYVFAGTEVIIRIRGFIAANNLSTIPVLLAGLGELSTTSQFSIAMPAYAISIANVLNGVVQSGSRDKTAVRFTAPEARILVVDDIVTNLNVVKGLLALYQIQIDTCTSGKAAIELIKDHAYDMVFMDHMMPEMDGIEATKIIRNLDRDYVLDLPIIALTANAVSGMRELFLESGMNDYLAKPIEIPKLNEIMERWIPQAKRLLPKPAEAKAGDKQPPDDADIAVLREQLAGVEGLDIADALTHLGKPENLRVVLKQFCEEFEEYVETIKTSFENKDWVDFSIRTHAVKGVCATIGMKNLAEWAKELELAAKTGDISRCAQDTLSFCEALAGFRQSLMRTPFMNENQVQT
jgi:CheY-like chemotaxis protein